MNHSTIVATADAACAVRPDWQQAGTISQIRVCAHTWPGTDAELAAHVLAIAADPSSRNPGAINATPTRNPNRPATNGNPPKCYTCGLTEDRCNKIRQRDIKFNLDPHEFETREQAEANKARHQIDARLRARADAEEARRQAAYKPEPDLDHHPCEHCGSTDHTRYTCPQSSGTQQPDQQESA